MVTKTVDVTAVTETVTVASARVCKAGPAEADVVTAVSICWGLLVFSSLPPECRCNVPKMMAPVAIKAAKPAMRNQNHTGLRFFFCGYTISPAELSRADCGALSNLWSSSFTFLSYVGGN